MLEQGTGVFALVLALALVIGILLGLLGGGGSILTVPLMSMGLGIETKAAIASSLFVVVVTSSIAVVPHARAGRVHWRLGIVFGLSGMIGAFGGGRLAAYLPATLLMVMFGAMMVATAAAMLRGPRLQGRSLSQLSLRKIIIDGVGVGALTGLVGAGGGFLVVPALVFRSGLPMPIAVGTSLLIIALRSAAGLAGHLGHVDLDWSIVLTITALAGAGSFIGARLAGRVPATALRRAFGVLVLVMGVVVLAKELLGA